MRFGAVRFVDAINEYLLGCRVFLECCHANSIDRRDRTSSWSDRSSFPRRRPVQRRRRSNSDKSRTGSNRHSCHSKRIGRVWINRRSREPAELFSIFWKYILWFYVITLWEKCFEVNYVWAIYIVWNAKIENFKLNFLKVYSILFFCDKSITSFYNREHLNI